AITIVASLIAVFVFRERIFAPKPIENVVFVWNDASGQQYVTTQTQEALAPEKIYPDHPAIKLVKVDDIKTPLKDKVGFTTVTYKLADETEAVYSLSDNGGRRTIFLIGETHLGKSQKEVAKKIVNLINTYEIDAIFLEQPETLKFDWSGYETLSNQPDKAIAALQERMIKDADRPMQLELGKYKVYFDNAKPKTKEEIMAVLEKIYADHGEEGAKEVIAMLNKLPDVSETNKLYEESKYISAADYLYFMLNLKGISIPFHNIESATLRTKFSDSLSTSTPNLDTTERDNHMVDAATRIVRSKNYRRVILICGALHLDSLKHMFSEKNYDVKIEYNSLADGKFKVDMATFKNPAIIKDIASEGPSSGFVQSGEFIAEKDASKQVMDIVDKYLDTKAKSFYSDSERTNIKNKFMEEYKARNLKGNPSSWTITIKEGNQSINVSKSATDDTVRIKSEPLSDLNREMASATPPKDDKMKLAYQTYAPNLNAQTKKRNEITAASSGVDSKNFAYYTVEQQPSKHILYDGNGNPLNNFVGDFEIPKVVDKIIEDTQTTERKVVYVAFKDYTPQQVDGFLSSARRQISDRGKTNIDIRPIEDLDSPEITNFFEAPGGITKISEAPVKETTGRFKGWFKTTVEFLTVDRKPLIMHYYTKTEELCTRLIQLLRFYIAPESLWNMDVRKGTAAGLATKTLIALGAENSEFKIAIPRENGKFQIVILTIKNKKEG
ncbi:MAG: hypothetical protein HQL03_08515, partial [Nitrospirae bacterium]|nr:hypothetical protein [Nitrospirota bacterium]